MKTKILVKTTEKDSHKKVKINLDGGESKHHVGFTLNVRVEHTENMLEVRGNDQRHLLLKQQILFGPSRGCMYDVVFYTAGGLLVLLGPHLGAGVGDTDSQLLGSLYQSFPEQQNRLRNRMRIRPVNGHLNIFFGKSLCPKIIKSSNFSLKYHMIFEQSSRENFN